MFKRWCERGKSLQSTRSILSPFNWTEITIDCWSRHPQSCQFLWLQLAESRGWGREEGGGGCSCPKNVSKRWIKFTIVRIIVFALSRCDTYCVTLVTNSLVLTTYLVSSLGLNVKVCNWFSLGWMVPQGGSTHRMAASGPGTFQANLQVAIKAAQRTVKNSVVRKMTHWTADVNTHVILQRGSKNVEYKQKRSIGWPCNSIFTCVNDILSWALLSQLLGILFCYKQLSQSCAEQG